MKGILFKPDILAAKLRVLDEYGEAQTRRLSGLEKINQEANKYAVVRSISNPLSFDFYMPHCMSIPAVPVTPRYQVGDTVYIKEAHYAYGHWTQFYETGKSHWEFFRDKNTVVHFADKEWGHALTKPSSREGWYKRSPLFLEAEFSRYFIKITDVRAQRFNIKELSAKEYLLEGGKTALYMLEKLDGKWIFTYTFQKVSK